MSFSLCVMILIYDVIWYDLMQSKQCNKKICICYISLLLTVVYPRVICRLFPQHTSQSRRPQRPPSDWRGIDFYFKGCLYCGCEGHGNNLWHNGGSSWRDTCTSSPSRWRPRLYYGRLDYGSKTPWILQQTWQAQLFDNRGAAAWWDHGDHGSDTATYHSVVPMLDAGRHWHNNHPVQ